MRKYHWSILLIINIAFFGCNKKANDNLDSSPEILKLSDKISNKTITSFAQDKYGYMWIGTNHGLNRYNGYDFHCYLNNSNPSSICDDRIMSLLNSSDGRMWIGTSNGICYYTSEDIFKQVSFEGKSDYAKELYETKKGNIVVNTGDFLEVYNSGSESFTITDTILHDNIYPECCIDNNGIIWAVSDNGIRSYDIDNDIVSDFIPTPYFITYFFKQSNDYLWLASGNKIQIFDINTQSFINPINLNSGSFGSHNIKGIFDYSTDQVLIYNDALEMYLYNTKTGEIFSQKNSQFPFEVPDMEISRMFIDQQENIWVGSRDNGFQVIYKYKQQFNSEAYLTSVFNQKSVLSITEDNNNNVWFLTNRHGLYVRNANRELKHISINGIERDKKILNIFIDSQRNVYLVYEYEIYKCKYADGILKPQIKYSIPEVNILSLNEDKYGRIWVGVLGPRIYILDKNKADYKVLKIIQPGDFSFISNMTQIPSGDIIGATFIQGITIFNPDDLSYKQYSLSDLTPNIPFSPTVIFYDSSGMIWLGCESNGLFMFNPITKEFTKIDTPSLNIKGIVEDKNNCLWLSTNEGLIKYDRSSDKFITYTETDGIGGDQFNANSALMTSDDLLIFGGIHGITVFNPSNLNYKQQIKLLFEDLTVNNSLQNAYKDPTLDKNLNEILSINLRNNDNYFGISYVGLGYNEFPTVRYNYILEGFEEEWVDARAIRQAFYSNLSPGNYTFRVRGWNNDYSTILDENSIEVIVHPGFWNHPLVIYFLIPFIILSIILLGFWQYIKISRSRQEIIQAIREKEQEKKLNIMNMNFFSNVSHEFRTPLTMINGPVEIMLNDNTINKKNHNLLIIIRRNIERMLRFVNQLMDISKIDSNNIKLNVTYCDIILLTNNLLEVFKINANEKGITIHTEGFENKLNTWLDRDKFEKILSNLVSNAMKFTNSGGNINIKLEIVSKKAASELFNISGNNTSDRYLKIVVKDSGIGIPEDQLDIIFERYYQVEPSSTGHYNWGTGIGLFYSKYLVELHHGQIKANNVSNGTGAEFTVILPMDDIVYIEDKHTINETQKNSNFVTKNINSEPDSNEEIVKSNEGKPTILIVEDDTEVAHFLKTLLSNNYHIETRFNASSAIEIIDKINPDLIISDVMMPGKMDGFDLCKNLKNNLATCHIPIILLTAKGNIEHQVEGLNYGADAYVVKPFAPSYLEALIKSQFANRERLRNILPKVTETDSIEEDILSYHDKQFMDKLYDLMEQELSNPELNINKIVDLLSISRTKLYYKIKNITGENPNAFFKTYKLNRAAQLLVNGKHNITETADETGFSSLSHFSQSFRKHFGVSPSEYVAEKLKKE